MNERQKYTMSGVTFYRDMDEGFSGIGPKGWKRTDERIKEDVCEALYHHPEVDASDIEVTVENGIVLLAGNVDSRNSKRMAEECLEIVSGIKHVINELKFKRVEKRSKHSLS